MGLMDFKEGEDNVGGRPTKEEQEEKEDKVTRRGPGYEIDPLTRENDSALFFEHLWDEFVDGEKPTNEEIADMSARACILSITLKVKMAEYGVWEADDLEEVKWNGGSKVRSSSKKGAVFGDDDDSGGDSSGLASLVNDAN